MNNTCVPSGVNIKNAYWVFFQRLHEKGIPEDQPTILCHLGLLLRAAGKEREGGQQGGLLQRLDRRLTVLLTTERGNALTGSMFIMQNPLLTTCPMRI